MLKKFERLIATGFGLGLLPKAPGTWGTLAGVVLYWLLSPLSFIGYLAFVAVGFLWGCWLCERVSREMKTYDHSSVVWDEIIGYCIAMIGLPRTWVWMLVGFILFRLFDIMKPWPIRWVDNHMKNGIGMMLDDLLAGLLVCVLFQLYRLI